MSDWSSDRDVPSSLRLLKKTARVHHGSCSSRPSLDWRLEQCGEGPHLCGLERPEARPVDSHVEAPWLEAAIRFPRVPREEGVFGVEAVRWKQSRVRSGVQASDLLL